MHPNNYLPDRMELIEADISWWNTFFRPALAALMSGDKIELHDIVDRYNQFISVPS